MGMTEHGVSDRARSYTLLETSGTGCDWGSPRRSSEREICSRMWCYSQHPDAPVPGQLRARFGQEKASFLQGSCPRSPRSGTLGTHQRLQHPALGWAGWRLPLPSLLAPWRELREATLRASLLLHTNPGTQQGILSFQRFHRCSGDRMLE